jgi:hypothetical protein
MPAEIDEPLAARIVKQRSLDEPVTIGSVARIDPPCNLFRMGSITHVYPYSEPSVVAPPPLVARSQHPALLRCGVAMRMRLRMRVIRIQREPLAVASHNRWAVAQQHGVGGGKQKPLAAAANPFCRSKSSVILYVHYPPRYIRTECARSGLLVERRRDGTTSQS